MYVQRAVLADSVTGSAGSSSQVQTQAQPASATYYPVFVSANNASATAMSEYTTSSFTINPATGNHGIGASPSGTYKLAVANTIQVGAQGGTDVTLIGGGSGVGSYIKGYYGTDGTQAFNIVGNGASYVQASSAGGAFSVGTSTVNTNGVLQVAGTIGLAPNAQIRQWTNSDSGTLQFFGTQVVVGPNNSTSYSYSEAGLLASVSNSDNAIVLDAGRANTLASGWARFRVVNQAGPNTSIQLSKGSTSTFYADTTNGYVGIGITNPSYKLVVSNAGAEGIEFGPGYSSGKNLFQSYNRSGSSYVQLDSVASIFTWSIGASEKLRLTANGGLAFNGSANYGSSGQVLQSNGDAAPSWVSPSSLAAASATQVTTQAQASNANYYPVFVSANNASATAMSEYTTSSFYINASSGNTVHGGTVLATAGLFTNALSGATRAVLSSNGDLNSYYAAESTARIQLGRDVGISGGAGLALGGSSYALVSTGDTTGGTLYFKLSASAGTASTSPNMTLNSTGLTVSGSIVAGSASSTNGSIILQGQYGSGAITNFGSEYSSGGPVVGYGVYPSNAAAGAFFSSSGLALTRAAYTQAGNVHNWYVGASQTVAIGGAATLSNVMSLNSSGQLMIGSGTAGAPLSFTDSLATKIQYNGNNANGYTVGLASAVNSGDAMMKFVAGATGAGEFGFYNTTNLRLLINNSGNVGINNSSPSYRLDVTGSLRSSAVALLGSSVGQGDPSSTDVTANATLLLSGVGGNYLSFGQKASNLCQWIQSAYSNPTTAVYPISLNPLGGSVGIGNLAPAQALHVTGQIIATSEITAYYSDRRLKENVKPVDNAIEKVLSLNGITYTPNELAESFGFERNTDVVGLFADEVEAVLPQAVKLAPFDQTAEGVSKSGENYKTIQYEKLVPLLVEAIKEQQQQITQLQELVNQLVNK
jgi:hypothetical protein